MSAEGPLTFAGCGWKDAEVTQLAQTLAFVHAAGKTTQAHMLLLSNNQLTDAGCAAIIRALERPSNNPGCAYE